MSRKVSSIIANLLCLILYTGTEIRPHKSICFHLKWLSSSGEYNDKNSALKAAKGFLQRYTFPSTLRGRSEWGLKTY